MKAVVLDEDVYLNKKLDILFHKPASWGFVHIAEFEKLKKEQTFYVTPKKELAEFEFKTFEEVIAWSELATQQLKKFKVLKDMIHITLVIVFFMSLMLHIYSNMLI